MPAAAGIARDWKGKSYGPAEHDLIRDLSSDLRRYSAKSRSDELAVRMFRVASDYHAASVAFYNSCHFRNKTNRVSASPSLTNVRSAGLKDLVSCPVRYSLGLSVNSDGHPRRCNYARFRPLYLPHPSTSAGRDSTSSYFCLVINESNYQVSRSDDSHEKDEPSQQTFKRSLDDFFGADKLPDVDDGRFDRFLQQASTFPSCMESTRALRGVQAQSAMMAIQAVKLL